jgi:galactonate dehydratase
MADLDIAEVMGWQVREPVSRRAYTVLKVRTRGGLEGWGECGVATASGFERARAALTGKPVPAYEALRPGLPASLAGGLNMALLDVLGKHAKAPVYQVLGGPARHKVRVLAAITTPQLATARAAGHRAFQVAVTAPAPLKMNELRAAAPDCDFVLDGHGAYSPGQASSVAADLESFHLLWFDEPCSTANLAAVRKIAEESVTPLGFGRDAAEPGFFQEMLREQLIDVLRPSLHRYGISQIRKLAAIAETYYVAVAPHHDGGPIATAGAFQLAASLPNFFIQQIPFAADADRRMRADLAGASLETVSNGFAALPGGPGLGIEVNETALKRYAEASL